MGLVPERKVVHRHYSPECPTGAVVFLVAVGSTLVGCIAAAATQSTETGLWIRPRGTALTEEFICAEGNRRSVFLPVLAGKPQVFVPRIA